MPQSKQKILRKEVANKLINYLSLVMITKITVKSAVL